MATLLIDYENVNSSGGLKGVEYLNERDTLIIFYSQSCEKMKAEYLEAIERSKCEFRIYKLVKSGKNALDFYIASECGCVIQTGETQIAIISKDKGFSVIPDFFHMKFENVKVVVAQNIENGLLTLNAPEDSIRRKMIQAKIKPMDIASAQARMQEHKDFVNRILRTFEETEYKEQSLEILNFIEEHREYTPKSLYTGSLHTFGRKDGRMIYQILKRVV